MTSGGRTRVVLSEPLHGVSPEGRVTGARIFKNSVKGVRSQELTLERCRPAFAEAATRRQAQGFSGDHTGPTARHFPPPDLIVTGRDHH